MASHVNIILCVTSPVSSGSTSHIAKCEHRRAISGSKATMSKKDIICRWSPVSAVRREQPRLSSQPYWEDRAFWCEFLVSFSQPPSWLESLYPLRGRDCDLCSSRAGGFLSGHQKRKGANIQRRSRRGSSIRRGSGGEAIGPTFLDLPIGTFINTHEG